MITVSRRVTSIAEPPLALLSERAARREREGRKVVRLGQAVPWYGPPSWALEALGPSLGDPTLHRYAPDPGDPTVRTLVCDRWFSSRGIRVDPCTEILLTCGASEAFLCALTACCDVGARVVLTDPYYFDHLFAVRFLDLEPRFVRMRETDEGFALDVEAVLEEIGEGCAAVVLVDPGNPTGSVASEEDLRAVACSCARAGTALILDETYERLTFRPRRWHPWQEEETRSCTVLVGSFSKSLGMAGWRLGYLLASAPLVTEALKVHDSVAICAPTVAQRLLRLVLEGPFEEWCAAILAELDERRRLVRDALAHSTLFRWRPTEGGIFSFIRYQSECDSMAMASRLLLETDVAVVPGSAFGSAGEYHLRLSFGSPPLDDLIEALERLRSLRR